MKWIDGGWTLRCEYGAAVCVNGSRICNLDTMESLIRKGLVERVAPQSFIAIRAKIEKEPT